MKRLTIGLLILILFAAALSVAAGKVWVPLECLDRGGSAIDHHRRTSPAAHRAGRWRSVRRSGCRGRVMQGYLRNPLADPGLFGVSSGAALGAVLSLFFGYAAQAWLLPAFALTGAGATMALLAMIAGRSGSLVLFTLAGTDPDQYRWIDDRARDQPGTDAVRRVRNRDVADGRADRPELERRPGRAAADRHRVRAILATTARSLDALTLGEAAARSIGVDPRRKLQLAVIAGTALTVGAAVAAAGVIGFVGTDRAAYGQALRRATVRPRSCCPPRSGGALLVTVADSLVRIAPTVSELRLGIAMSLLGGPFFLVAARAHAPGARMSVLVHRAVSA